MPIHSLILAGFTPDYLAGGSSFLASTVEFVEAFTIVLVVGLTINWKSSLLGTLLAALTLAVIVAIFGLTLINFPITYLRLVVGVVLVLFGQKWLKKALLRYSGRKSLHDEEAIYEEQLAEIKARGDVVPGANAINPFGVVTAYKSVLLEGLEVAFIVITFGATGSSHAAITANSRANSLASATIGAVLAGLLVIGAGVLVRAPLSRVPENTLKFVVGVMLTSFGVFWGGEGLGIKWPLPDLITLPILIAVFLVMSFVAVQLLRPPTARSVAAPTASAE